MYSPINMYICIVQPELKCSKLASLEVFHSVWMKETAKYVQAALKYQMCHCEKLLLHFVCQIVCIVSLKKKNVFNVCPTSRN